MQDMLSYYQSTLCLIDREKIEEKISHLGNKKYNRYHWWRRYQDIQQLDEKAPILSKIINGDYEYPLYFYQAQHEIYLMWDEVKDMKPNEDRIDRINLYMERYRRLMEDSEKEEHKRFNAFKKRLQIQFKISKEFLEEVMECFEGTNEDLYLYLQKLHHEKNSIRIS